MVATETESALVQLCDEQRAVIAKLTEEVEQLQDRQIELLAVIRAAASCKFSCVKCVEQFNEVIHK